LVFTHKADEQYIWKLSKKIPYTLLAHNSVAYVGASFIETYQLLEIQKNHTCRECIETYPCKFGLKIWLFAGCPKYH
jgi:hypothetical protein